MITVLATGIAGCGKPRYLREFEKFCFENGKNCKVVSIGDLMFQAAEEIGIKVKEEKILNLPRTTLRTLISLAFERCLIEYSQRKSNYDLMIISTHASYWWKNGPEHAFDISFLNKIKIDIYVTFINDIVRIRDKIYSDPKWGREIIKVSEIITWQELEIYTTEIMAMLQNKSFYVFHVDYPLQTFYDMIFSNKPKIYTSFPMTFFKSTYKVRKFINFLQKYAVVFSPSLEEDKGKFEEKIPINQLRNWIVRKDYKLIDQSDILVAYFPEIIHSPGVEKEISYAHTSNKEVWLIFPQKKLSPFTPYYSDKIFNSFNQFKKFFLKFIKQSKR
ncbi:MAG: AAA family ATPase [Candidatus Aenigmarchaeota archaeon]|nr:AAA family ATPase [Candidatus Aenigmarchaeota archaeon]MDW8149250.1 AAA family ATPase [Candidatus Aenigmarchaeota archaeon]